MGFKLLMLLILLTSCGENVYYPVIRYAEVVCKNNGGLSHIVADGHYDLRCENGATFTVTFSHSLKLRGVE